jgi:hypothetical protein
MPATDFRDSTPLPPEHEAHNTKAIPRRRHLRWGRIAAGSFVAVLAVWGTSRWTANRIESNDIDRRQPALPDFPKPSRIAVIHNSDARLARVASLGGTAVLHTAEAPKLVSEGRFLTNLPLTELALRLKVSPESIADPRSPAEVNPAAELFRAQVVTLTENAKERSRQMRKRQLQQGKAPDGVYAEWNVRIFSFTIKSLQNPTAEEAEVLSAIIAAKETLPQPGDKIRAVGVARGEIAPGRIATAAGYLPIQTKEEATKEILGGS